jgi:hypothetical protein
MLFDWLGRHPYWTALGAFVFIGTVTIILLLDRNDVR